MSTVVVNSGQRNPGCLVQFLWFIFIGWWLGGIWITLAWLLMLTVIGILVIIGLAYALAAIQRHNSQKDR